MKNTNMQSSGENDLVNKEIKEITPEILQVVDR